MTATFAVSSTTEGPKEEGGPKDLRYSKVSRLAIKHSCGAFVEALEVMSMGPTIYRVTRSGTPLSSLQPETLDARSTV